MTPDVDPIGAFAAQLAEDGGLKLWSVLVTLLGDMALGAEEEVPGPVLSAVVARIGLQPQAMRVAVHRLKRDGWVESRRSARIGFYWLSEQAQAQTRAVQDRVYGPTPQVPGPLWLAILPEDTADTPDMLVTDVPLLMIGRRAAVVAQRREEIPSDWMACPMGVMPHPAWVEHVIEEAACQEPLADLTSRLAAFDGLAEAATPEDRLAIRLLTLHAWRRLILRANPVAEALLGDKAASYACRAKVTEILAAAPRPDVASLGGVTP